jgi:hypothetical protein
MPRTYVSLARPPLYIHKSDSVQDKLLAYYISQQRREYDVGVLLQILALGSRNSRYYCPTQAAAAEFDDVMRRQQAFSRSNW